MGKGDKKTKKGKIFNGSYGVKRPRKEKSKYKCNNKECIYCGISLLSKTKSLQYNQVNKKYPDNGETKDHIPQQCLFEGYAPNFKTNRFTVPACHNCNLEFSKNEQELRDLIGVANDNDNMQNTITESAVKNILTNSNKKLLIDNEGHVRGVEFDLDKLQPSHIKNFKGVFYKTYGKRLSDGFEVKVVDIKLKNDFEKLAKDYLDKNTTWKYSGHEDIFKYRIDLIKSNSTGTLVKAGNLNETDLIVCHLVYHKKYEIMVLGHRKKMTKRKI